MKEMFRIIKGKKLKPFFWTWYLVVISLWFRFYQEEVEIINTTSLAFNYTYGFISRGFMGTIYWLIDLILPINMIDYDCVVFFTLITTILYVALLFVFFYTILAKCKDSMMKNTQYLILFFTFFAVSMFLTKYNFGRFDMYLLMLSLIGALLLIYEKAEWMVVPLSAIGVMIHQGNVFYFLNIILILLIYKALSTDGKKRKKYIIYFVLSFLVASVLFLYFEFFSRGNGEAIVEEITAVAEALRYDGDVHEDVIAHEILGEDLTENEVIYRYKNFTEFPFFILLMSPYLVMAFRFFKNLIKKAQTKLDKCKYLFVSIGAATMIPTIILKCDFGRWMFMIMAYYFVVVLALIAMKDKLVEEEVKNTFAGIRKLGIGKILVFIYPILFLPFKDVVISQMSYDFAKFLNDNFLHLWK